MFNNPYYGGNGYYQSDIYRNNLQNMQTPQTIQTIQQIQPQVMSYFASNVNDMSNIQVNPNIIYLGINVQSKEIYTKQMNNDGITETNIYKISDGKQEQNIMNTIMERLNNIDEKMKGYDNARKDNEFDVATKRETIKLPPNNANV